MLFYVDLRNFSYYLFFLFFKPNRFDFGSGISEWQTTFEMVYSEIGPLVIQSYDLLMQSRIRLNVLSKCVSIEV